MIKWIRGWIFLIRQYRKQKKISSDLYHAQKHALLALAYWKRCGEAIDLHFQIEEPSIYVRLGKGIDLCQAVRKKNSEKLC